MNDLFSGEILNDKSIFIPISQQLIHFHSIR